MFFKLLYCLPFIISVIAATSIHTNRRMYRRDTSEVAGVVSYEELKKAGSNKSIYIIDVRDPKELQETGVIPGSINVPLAQLQDVLEKMSSEDFKLKFGRDKPKFGDPIIFSCRSGRRSLQALKLAESLGYKNVKHFEGGWLLWEKKTNEEKGQ